MIVVFFGFSGLLMIAFWWYRGIKILFKLKFRQDCVFLVYVNVKCVLRYSFILYRCYAWVCTVSFVDFVAVPWGKGQIYLKNIYYCRYLPPPIISSPRSSSKREYNRHNDDFSSQINRSKNNLVVSMWCCCTRVKKYQYKPHFLVLQ